MRETDTMRYAESARLLGYAWRRGVMRVWGTLPSVRVQAEDPATLHVGQIAAVHMPSERHYTIGSAGSSLVLLKTKEQQGTTIYVYRAAAIGNHTLIATPGGLGAGQCISCVTVHYFIKVIQ